MHQLIEKIKANPRLKKVVLHLMMHPVKTRPRLWLRLLQPFYLKRGKKSVIYRNVRKDLVPFKQFVLGNYSVVESFSTLNNAVGDIIIGDKSRIGISSLILGPAIIGNHVNLGQHVIVSGLNHDYQDIKTNASKQSYITKIISINDNVWIGANSIILPGVHIGEHCMIGAGSVVTKNIPSYSVAVGNPARVIKRYDFDKKIWVNIKTES